MVGEEGGKGSKKAQDIQLYVPCFLHTIVNFPQKGCGVLREQGVCIRGWGPIDRAQQHSPLVPMDNKMGEALEFGPNCQISICELCCFTGCPLFWERLLKQDIYYFTSCYGIGS